jgi:hypothetical protein
MVFKLVRERKDHRLGGQILRDHDCDAKRVVQVGTSNTLEPMRPEVDSNAFRSVDSAHV